MTYIDILHIRYIPSMFSHLHPQAHHLHLHVDPRGAKAHEDRRKTTGGGSQLVHATNLPHAANDLATGEFTSRSGSPRDRQNEPNGQRCFGFWNTTGLLDQVLFP